MKERERERKKLGVNNGQLRLQTPPRVAHANRLDQKKKKKEEKKKERKMSEKTIASFASTEAAWTKKTSENYGQLCIHGSRMEQKNA